MTFNHLTSSSPLTQEERQDYVARFSIALGLDVLESQCLLFDELSKDQQDCATIKYHNYEMRRHVYCVSALFGSIVMRLRLDSEVL